MKEASDNKSEESWPPLKFNLNGGFLHVYCQKPPSFISGDCVWSEWHTLHNLAFRLFPLLLKNLKVSWLLDCVPHTGRRFPQLLEGYLVVEGGFPLLRRFSLTDSQLFVNEWWVGSMGQIEDSISPISVSRKTLDVCTIYVWDWITPNLFNRLCNIRRSIKKPNNYMYISFFFL